MFLRFLFLLTLLGLPAAAGADETARPADRPQETPVRLFLDCVLSPCDFDYIRTEIRFVDYVNTREDADVHLLVTSQRTGSGGLEYTMQFIGRGRFAGMNDEMRYTSLSTETADERREGLARLLAIGLARYAAATAAGERLRIVEDRRSPPRESTSALLNDPWDLWVFRMRFSGRADAEEQVSQYGMNGTVSANRTTDAWKIILSGDGYYSQGDYDLGEDERYRAVSRAFGARALVVKSLTERWSAGLRGGVSQSTYVNQEAAGRVAPAIEYNIFPYSESTRRRLTLQYAVGLRTFDYYQETIYGKTSETLWDHSAEVALDLKQPWGTVNASLDGSQYLYDLSKFRVELDAEFDVRLFKGFSLNLNGNSALIRNQIYLPAGDATSEEILVRQRQLATSYRHALTVGFSYTFGSIYNNVVNRRFGG